MSMFYFVVWLCEQVIDVINISTYYFSLAWVGSWVIVSLRFFCFCFCFCSQFHFHFSISYSHFSKLFTKFQTTSTSVQDRDVISESVLSVLRFKRFRAQYPHLLFYSKHFCLTLFSLILFFQLRTTGHLLIHSSLLFKFLYLNKVFWNE